MKILVINAGSSSLKYQLIDMTDESCMVKGICERIGAKGGVLTQKTREGKTLVIKKDMPTHTEAMQLVIDAMLDKENGAISSMAEISAVGHRVLHGAEDFHSSIIFNEENLKTCEKNIDLGPLHMPANLACVKSCMEVMPGIPMVAVFDTTFHSTMPQKAFMYAIPYSVYEKYKVRKYGFHGTSHKFVSEEAIKIIGEKKKIITCHLGNGSSIAAVYDGKCVDTTMGFTPLEGLMMGTRSGDIDPAAVDFMREKLGISSAEMVQYLNKKCGMLGVSELSSDCRDLTAAAESGNEKAQLALEMTAYRVKKYIGSFTAALGGVDAIVFTGGIGEHSPLIRGLVMENMEFLGVDFDKEKNDNYSGGIADLTKTGSKVKVFIIPTNEELSIARETAALVKTAK
ncbi:MAG: acetate kinase [Clostridiales bacterium]|nr:acetate kinase [Clostridiales bacterium]